MNCFNLSQTAKRGLRTLLQSIAALAGMTLIAPAEAALLLHYNFDEASSGTAAALDSGTGTAANGTFSGSSTRTGNTPGNASLGAMDTNGGGLTDFVFSADPNKLDGLQQFTLITWFNLQAAPTGLDRFISKHDTSNNGFDWYAPAGVTSGSMRMVLDIDGVNGTNSGTFNPGLNNWAFLAVTYDGSAGSNNVNYFIGYENVAVSQLGSAVTLNQGTVNLTTADLRVGGTNRSASDRTPDAFFDEVRIYDTVLNAAALDVIRLETVTEPAIVPEPATAWLLALGGALMLVRRRSHFRGRSVLPKLEDCRS